METSMTVKEAAQLLGKTEQFVRCGLQQERLPFGSAVKMNKQWSYYISAQKLREFIGGNHDDNGQDV